MRNNSEVSSDAKADVISVLRFCMRVGKTQELPSSFLLNEEGFDSDVIEAALAHTGKNEVRNAYNRTMYIERRKPVMKCWSEHIESAAAGNMSLTGNKGLKLVSI